MSQAGTTLLPGGYLEFPQLGAAPGPGVSPAGGSRLYYNGTTLLVSYAGGAYAVLASPDFTSAVTINTSTAPALDILTDAVSGTILRVQHDVSTTPTGALTAILADLATNWVAGNVGHTGIDIRVPATTAVAANGVAALAINSDATVARVMDIDVANVSGTIAQIRYGVATSLSEKLTGLLIDAQTLVTPGANSIQGLEILTAAGTAADAAGTAVFHIDSNCTLQRVVDIDVANTGGTIAGLRYGGAATLTAALTGLSVNLNTNVTPSASPGTYINGAVVQVAASTLADVGSTASAPGALTANSGALIVYSRQTLGRVADFLGENLGGTHVHIRYPIATTITAAVQGLNVDMNFNVGEIGATAQIVRGMTISVGGSTAVDAASTTTGSPLTLVPQSGALIIYSRQTLGRVVDVIGTNVGGTLVHVRQAAVTQTAALTGVMIDMNTNITVGGIIRGAVIQVGISSTADSASTVAVGPPPVLTANSGALIVYSGQTLGRVVDILCSNAAGTLALIRYPVATTLSAALTGLRIDLFTGAVTAGANAVIGLQLDIPASSSTGSVGLLIASRATAGREIDIDLTGKVSGTIINVDYNASTELTGSLVGLELELRGNVIGGANAISGIIISTAATTRASTAFEGALVLNSLATAARVFDCSIANTTGTPINVRYNAAATPNAVVMMTLNLSTNVNTNTNANVGLDIPIVAADEDTTAPLRMNTKRFFVGTGVPNNANGSDNDDYFRIDGGGAGATHHYFKNAGAWIGIA